jgi:hypothetical protein
MVGVAIGGGLGACLGWLLNEWALFAMMGAMMGFLAGGISVWVKAKTEQSGRLELREPVADKNDQNG